MADKPITFWQELKERRVPQLVGLYLGASWVVLEFTGFLTDRYALSPNLIDLILVSMVSMLPSVFVLAYTHGKPGKDEWTQTELVVIPVNFLIAIMLIINIFSGKELGATTVTVTTENASGESVERVVPKAAFRKKVALFFLNDNTGVEKYRWVSRWISYGVHLDLMQDVYFDSRGPYQMSVTLIDAGAADGEAPLALQRQLAVRLHRAYFFNGTVLAVEPYKVEINLHRSRGGRLIFTQIYEGQDLGAIIDRITLDLKGAVELSEKHIAEAPDLPVTALSTENIKALRLFTDGMQALYYQSDYAVAYQALSRAAHADPTFVQAQFNLYQASRLLGKEDPAAIQAAFQHIYKVPERLQGAIKEVYYLSKGQPEQALSALQLDAILFPDDIIANRRLAQFYMKVGDYSEALRQYQLVADLNPEDDLALRDLAQAQSAMGHFKDALKYLKKFARSNPRDAEVLIETGEIYQLLGETRKAARMYNRASLLGLNPAKVLIRQSRVEFQEGAYETALEFARQAADQAQSPDVKFEALQLLEDIYASLGRIVEAMAIARENMPVGRHAFGPMNSVILRMNHFGAYARTTLADSVYQMLSRFDEGIPPPWDEAVRVMLVIYKIRQENRPVSADEMSMVKKFFNIYLFVADYSVEEVEAGIYLSNGEYRLALQRLIATLSRYPRRLMVQIEMARAYRLMGDAEAAMATIRPLVEVMPNAPMVLYELLQIQQLTGPAAALSTLERLGEIWADADEIFIPMQDVGAQLDAAATL